MGMVADRLLAAAANLMPPFAVVDLDALDDNATSMITRARGLPIRLAMKTIRCRAITNRVLERSEFQGVLPYSLGEAIWLARSGIPDVLLGYPTLDHSGFADLAQDDQLCESIMVVLDSVAHCDIIASVAAGRKIKVCMDIDASLRIGPLHVGVRRSPVHSATEAYTQAAEIVKPPELSLIGLMFYDAQIAGLPNNSVAIRAVKHVSVQELLERREEIITAVRRFADLDPGPSRDEFSQNRPRAEWPQGHLSLKSAMELPRGGDSEKLGVYQAARRDSVPSFMLRPRLTSANHKVISR